VAALIQPEIRAGYCSNNRRTNGVRMAKSGHEHAKSRTPALTRGYSIF
jgi:hypothetical protein